MAPVNARLEGGFANKDIREDSLTRTNSRKYNDIFQITEETNLVLRRFAYDVFRVATTCIGVSCIQYVRTIARVNGRASGCDACALKVLWWIICLFHTIRWCHLHKVARLWTHEDTHSKFHQVSCRSPYQHHGLPTPSLQVWRESQVGVYKVTTTNLFRWTGFG
jgi:hypothetical protein